MVRTPATAGSTAPQWRFRRPWRGGTARSARRGLVSSGAFVTGRTITVGLADDMGSGWTSCTDPSGRPRSRPCGGRGPHMVAQYGRRVFLSVLAVCCALVAVLLVGNGVRALRRGARSLTRLLALVAGTVLLALDALVVVLARVDTPTSSAVLVLVLAVAGYVAVAFLVFLGAALAYGHVRVSEQAEALVVLGCGLVHGQVSPMLRSRLDRAVEVFRRSDAAGRTPVVVASGGQGADEDRTEADAMAEYLVGHGLPADLVLREPRSRNTRENLRFSSAVLQDAGVDGRTLVVTNDYHVMRTAITARRTGLDARVLGSPTARQAVPSAFLREFAAVLVMHRWWHLAAVVAIVALWSLGLATGVLPR
ncbi:YdcF family protein [Curtobacterium sp. MCBD17_023]|nr:YdcF family protein [Curtobacterium sp. MCBD17_023]